MEIALAISILGAVISVSTFVLNRKDKSNKDTKEDSYKWGQIDTKLSNIEKTLVKIEDKLDNFENETRKIAKEEIDKHELKYHKG